MKRKVIVLIVMMLLGSLVWANGKASPQEDDAQLKRTYDLKKAYAYLEEQLIISKTDLYCSYFIRNRMDLDIEIIGAREMDTRRTIYSDRDRMFINKGAKDGINEGDIYMVIAEGEKVSNRLTGDHLGTYYLMESMSEVICVYEETAEIVLKKGCWPVRVGDYLVPFKARQILFMKILNYMRCRLPDADITGRVVFSSIYLQADKSVAGPNYYVTTDLGKAVMEKDDFVLFYKYVRKDLPPVIYGFGVVLNPENTNCTIKVIESAYPVLIGHHIAPVPDEEIQRLLSEVSEGEQVPALSEAAKTQPGEMAKDSLHVNLLFNINEKEVDASHVDAFEKIKEFIGDKTDYEVVLRGYTCSIGGFEYNLQLSKQRVDNVKAYLVKNLGISVSLIESNFYGEKEPPHDNTTEEQRRRNRTVSIEVIMK